MSVHSSYTDPFFRPIFNSNLSRRNIGPVPGRVLCMYLKIVVFSCLSAASPARVIILSLRFVSHDELSFYTLGTVQAWMVSTAPVSDVIKSHELGVTYPAIRAIWLLRPANLEADVVVAVVDGALGLGGKVGSVGGGGTGNLDS